MRVEFLASVARGAPFTLEPEVSHIDSAPGPDLRDAFSRAQPHGLAADGAGRAERRAGRRGALLQQGRMLLLHEPGVQPHEELELKLAFMVATELPAHVDTLSLSYTYFTASN